MSDPNCHACALVKRRDVGEAPLWDNIIRSGYWDLAHSFNSSLEGWLVLILRRHASAVAELEEVEALELGQLLRAVSQALSEVTGCVKTYLAQFAEDPQHQHVHVHVVPRAADLPETDRGTRVFRHLGAEPPAIVAEGRMTEIAVAMRQRLAHSLARDLLHPSPGE